MIKKGDIFYCAWLSVSHLLPDEKPSIQLEEWIVTHIDKRGYFLKQKVNKITWVKKSKKHFDYGWADNIDDYYKKLIPLNTPFQNYDLYKTKKQAYKSIIPEIQKGIRSLKRLLNKAQKIK